MYAAFSVSLPLPCSPLYAPLPDAIVQRAKELVEFARHHGYRLDELVGIIEDAG